MPLVSALMTDMQDPLQASADAMFKRIDPFRLSALNTFPAKSVDLVI